ncbi:tumor necrosis factor receptor superfamily member 18 [Suncus etruscus]|uniref:tumor necrosis factor receptor superfamily member 18 n=1 Tax=Suncus etruscus TaxID=109475 RepID=UPI00210F441D|nr:tumor necrosis factor receptor superfamily member 18 [Suncus etruscus]
MARGARGPLRAVALLCALQALGLAQHCGPGRTSRGSGTNTRCCRSCTPGTVVPTVPETCPEVNCTCATPEFHCGDPDCLSCVHHPCPPGQGVRPHGSFSFSFDCADCVSGTFSGGREGRCRPWADCSQFGFSTVFPGNSTHNALCLPGPSPLARPDGLCVAVLAMGACVLVLLGAQLILHLWQLRRRQPRLPDTPLLQDAAVGHGPPAEDTCSCQFPQEEWGEPRPEDKGQLHNLWV